MEGKIRCSVCGANLNEDTVEVFAGNVYCDNCLSEKTVVCADCNERIWREDAEGEEDLVLCRRCYDYNYTSCDDCGRLLHNDDAYYDDDDDDYPYCYACNQRRMHFSENVANKHLSEEIFEERDAIFTWGIEGLKKYVESGERFPKSVLSAQIKQKNIARYCPEKVFFDRCVDACEGYCESVTAIKAAYKRFCSQIGTLKNNGIGRYIEKVLGVEKVKKRLRGEENPIYVYQDVRLKGE